MGEGTCCKQHAKSSTTKDVQNTQLILQIKITQKRLLIIQSVKVPKNTYKKDVGCLLNGVRLK